MLVSGQQEQGCGQGLPFPAWDITTAEEPEAQAERPNSQRFKISPWKLFGCWRPGLFLAALGRSVFLLLRSRAGMNKELSSLPPRAQPWQHRLELCALSQLSRPGMSSPAWGSTHEWLRSYSSFSPLNQTFPTQRGQQPTFVKMGPVLLPGFAPASLLEADQRHLGCRNASAPKRALGTERTRFLTQARGDKPQNKRQPIVVSPHCPHCHSCSGHFYQLCPPPVALVFYSEAPTHPPSCLGVGSNLLPWYPLLRLCPNARL